MNTFAIDLTLTSACTRISSRWASRLAVAVWMVVCLCVADLASGQVAGSADPSFDPGGSGVNSTVLSVAAQANGKAIIGGYFTLVNGAARQAIARLNADGSLDATFNPGTGASGVVQTLAVQTDGKIVIGGGFTTVSGVARSCIARLHANGSVDTTFDPGSGTDGTVYSVVVQTNGKVVIGGNFTSVNGVPRSRVARLNSDGSLDTTFITASDVGSYVQSVAVQSDGKILLGGYFFSVNGVARSRVARLNADGSLDTSFNPGTGANNTVKSVAVQVDGKVIIAGGFTSYNGVTRNRIARLNADGSLDTAFDPGTGPSDYILSATVQTDGKIVIGGDFSIIGDVAQGRISRLNANGSLDTTFNSGSGPDSSVYSVAVHADGKVLVGGGYTYVNGVARTGIARFGADGSLDTSFNPVGGVGGTVLSVAVQDDGKVLIGGQFTSINGVVRNRVARLNADGSLDTSFNPGTGANGAVQSVMVQVDGKVIIGGYFTTVNDTARSRVARLNANGTLDTTFDPGTGPNNYLSSVAVQADGKVLIGGAFTKVNVATRFYITRLNVDGSLDTAFSAGVVDSNVRSIVVQTDGKIVIGGAFSLVGSMSRRFVARLNGSGSLDTTFNSGSGPDNGVYSVAVQTGGKVVIGGNFTNVNGVARQYLARFDADGSFDTTFNPGTGMSTAVQAVAVQADGKIIAGSNILDSNNIPHLSLTRFNANGSLDAAFNAAAKINNNVSSVAVQSDGKIVLGGIFASVNGLGFGAVARLFGGDVTAASPSVASGAADSLQTTGAVVRTNVNPEGLATTVWFQYGLTTSYGSTTATAQGIGSGAAFVGVNATLSGLTPSTLYHYRAVAFNNVGTTYGADATFTTLSLAQDWQQQYFGTTSGTGFAADGADPDGDGVSNLLERALGLNPTQAGTAGLPVTTRDTATGRLILTAAKGVYASDLTFSAEASADLLNWTTAGVSVLANTSTTFQARDDGLMDGRRFLRLRVTAPGSVGRLSIGASARR